MEVEPLVRSLQPASRYIAATVLSYAGILPERTDRARACSLSVRTASTPYMLIWWGKKYRAESASRPVLLGEKGTRVTCPWCIGVKAERI